MLLVFYSGREVKGLFYFDRIDPQFSKVSISLSVSADESDE